MTTIRVDAPAFRDLILAAAEALEEMRNLGEGNIVTIDNVTLFDLHQIVNSWHPEPEVQLHFLHSASSEVIHD